MQYHCLVICSRKKLQIVDLVVLQQVSAANNKGNDVCNNTSTLNAAMLPVLLGLKLQNTGWA